MGTFQNIGASFVLWEKEAGFLGPYSKSVLLAPTYPHNKNDPLAPGGPGGPAAAESP